APGAYRPPRRFAMARMAAEDVLQALLLEHGEGLAQPVEQVRRRRVWKEATLVRPKHRAPVPVRAPQPCIARRRQRLLGDGIEGEAGWEHQALLRARHRHVDLPVVVAVIDGG